MIGKNDGMEKEEKAGKKRKEKKIKDFHIRERFVFSCTPKDVRWTDTNFRLRKKKKK